MSQPPQQYPYSVPQQQQPYAYDPYGQHVYGSETSDPFSPARRASVMMFVLGGLLLLCGVACGGMGALAPWDEVFRQQPELQQQFPGMTTALIQAGVIGFGAAGFVVGMILIVLGYFVRGGGAGAVITALVLTSVIVLALLLFSAIALVQGIMSGQAQMLAGTCVYLMPLTLFGILLLFLIQAARAIPRVRQAQVQQAAYWQYAQQQQAYQQSMQAYQQQQQQQPPSPPAGGAGENPPPNQP